MITERKSSRRRPAQRAWKFGIGLIAFLMVAQAICHAGEASHDPTLSQRIAGRARQCLAGCRDTTYSHHTVIDEKEGIYQTDCSGFVDHLLRQTSPGLLKEVESARAKHRALAEDYVTVFQASPPAEDHRQRADGWFRVGQVANARAGDILAWSNPAHVAGEHTDTGHVMVVEDTPVEDNIRANGRIMRMYRVTVIDCANSGHAEDTRKPGTGGLGRGTLWLEVDGSGQALACHWKSQRGKAREVPIAIGRAVGA